MRCVFFPEGRLTTSGEIETFRKGIERIITQTPVPVVPMALQGLWGSFSATKAGPALTKLPKRFWSRIQLVVGSPIPAERPSPRRGSNKRSKPCVETTHDRDIHCMTSTPVNLPESDLKAQLRWSWRNPIVLVVFAWILIAAALVAVGLAEVRQEPRQNSMPVLPRSVNGKFAFNDSKEIEHSVALLQAKVLRAGNPHVEYLRRAAHH